MKENETRKTQSKVECLSLEKLQPLVVWVWGVFPSSSPWGLRQAGDCRDTRSAAFWSWGLGAHPLCVHTLSARPRRRAPDYEKWVPHLECCLGLLILFPLCWCVSSLCCG